MAHLSNSWCPLLLRAPTIGLKAKARSGTAGHRIHIFGASGSGTSTLGRALADALASQHFDTDDFYWLPTDPPFREKRTPKDRRALMKQVFLPRRDWVLSGSMDSWSEGVDHRFTLAVFLELEAAQRIARLRGRELLRHDTEAGDATTIRKKVAAFLDWAAAYDDGLLPLRNRARHESWSKHLDCPVLRMDSNASVPVMVAKILSELNPTPMLAFRNT